MNFHEVAGKSVQILYIDGAIALKQNLNISGT